MLNSTTLAATTVTTTETTVAAITTNEFNFLHCGFVGAWSYNSVCFQLQAEKDKELYDDACFAACDSTGSDNACKRKHRYWRGCYGAFSLVRFRSVPGSAMDICAIFLSMAVGLATGTNHLALALMLAVCVSLLNIIYTLLPIGKKKSGHKDLSINYP